MVNYSHKCQLTWIHGLCHMVHFVIKIQKLLLGAGKINELDHFFFLPTENEWRPLFLSIPFLWCKFSDLGFSFVLPNLLLES